MEKIANGEQLLRRQKTNSHAGSKESEQGQRHSQALWGVEGQRTFKRTRPSQQLPQTSGFNLQQHLRRKRPSKGRNDSAIPIPDSIVARVAQSGSRERQPANQTINQSNAPPKRPGILSSLERELHNQQANAVENSAREHLNFYRQTHGYMK